MVQVRCALVGSDFFDGLEGGWLWVLSYCLEKEKSMDGFFLYTGKKEVYYRDVDEF